MIPDHCIAIVCNPGAGKGRALKLAAQVEAELNRRQIAFKTYKDQWPAEFAGCTAVFIVGGDGTLNYFINRYPAIKVPLTVFRGGSGNDFAWKLYGNISFEEQVERVLQGNTFKVDAGTCNGHYFLNGVGIGFDGEVVRSMGKKRFISAGFIEYYWTVLKKILIYREKQMRLEYEAGVSDEKLFMVSVANGSRYGGGFLVAPQAIINDGQLDLVMIHCIHSLRRFIYLPKVEKGKHLHYPFVKTAHTQKIIVTTLQPVAAHVDGELLEDTRFEIEILAGHFQFLQ